MTEEILDIVDDNDNVIEVLTRREVFARDIHNVRTINCFIKNSKGELWIPRRTATKKTSPLALGISCGGFVSSGETYEDGFRREIQEELSIDIDAIPWKEIATLTPKKDGVGTFMKVYEILQDTVPDFNLDDFCEYYWLTPRDVLQEVSKDATEANEKIQNDLPKLVKLLYL